MNETIATILTLLGGGAAGAVLVKLLDILSNRSRDRTEQAAIVVNTKETAVNTEKIAAEKARIETETRITAADYYQKTADDLAAQVVEIKTSMATDKAAANAEISNIKSAQEEGLRQYEQRAGKLVEEIKTLSTDLKAAKETIERLKQTIEQNNITIASLQNEVKAGNEKIESLQNVITNLNQKITDLMERLLNIKTGE